MADIKLKLETEDRGASRNLAKFYNEVNKVDKEMKDLAASAKKAGKAASAGMKEAGAATGKTTKKFETLNAMAHRTAGNITSFIGSFAGIAGIVQGLRSMVASMQEASELRAGMLETAVDVEGQMMKIAQLRGDVTPGGISAVRADVEDIALKAHVPLEIASPSLFFAESSLGPGTTAAKSAAITTTQFAGAAGLTAEEVKMMPKLYNILGADTRDKQMVVLNKLRAATGGSIAETGEYIEPFISVVVTDIERGFTFEQSLAKMTTAIEVTGSVSEAGTTSRVSAEITAGRTTAARGWLGERAAERGLDYSAMTNPQRHEFVSRLYQEYKAGGPSKLDEFKAGIGASRGVKFLQMMFGEAATRKYEAMLPAITAAGESTAVQEMAEQYATTQTAISTDQETNKRLAEARTGRQRAAQTRLDAMTSDIFGLAHAELRGAGDYARVGLTPNPLEKRTLARMVVRENLLLGMEGEDPAEVAELKGLYKEFRNIQSLTTNPEFVRRAYEATGGFGLVRQQGRIVDWESVDKSLEERYPADSSFGYSPIEERLRPSHYMRGFEQYYGIAESINQAAENLNRAADKLDRAVPSGIGEEAD